MKLTSVLVMTAAVAFALVSSSVDSVAATSDCTQNDAKTILSLTGVILADSNCLDSTDSECPNAKCYATFEKVTKDMPNCEADGKNLKETFQKLLKECKMSSTGGSSTSTATSPSSTPMATTADNAKSAANGRGAVTAAVVALSSFAGVMAFV